MIEQLTEDLDVLAKDMNSIASDWNGSDETFNSGGNLYHEEDAQLAGEVENKIIELIELLEEVETANLV